MQNNYLPQNVIVAMHCIQQIFENLVQDIAFRNMNIVIFLVNFPNQLVINTRMTRLIQFLSDVDFANKH